MEEIKKFNQYVKGTLPEVELDSFTKEIVKDHFEKEKFQSKWNRILEEEHNRQGTVGQPKGIFSLGNSKRFLRIGLSVAASVLVLMVCWFNFQPASTPTYETFLSEELNQPYVESITRKGDVEELRLQAVASYNSRDYATALRYFEEIKSIDEAVDWDFYIGLCQLYQKQSDLAIKSFSTVLERSKEKYKPEANWFLGLAYIMTEDFESAKKHLVAMINLSNHEMAWKVKEAKELLDVLDEQE